MVTQPIFKLNSITKSYGENTVIDINSLTIDSGDFLAIVGPSGAGKSTLLQLLHFLIPPTSGTIKFNNQIISHPVSVETIRKIATVFQRPALMDGRVIDNIIYPLKVRGIPINGALIKSIMSQLALTELQHKPAYTLSGGELQRVALARILVYDPEVILLDEPTANLDPYNVELIENIMSQNHQAGKTIILVTHNIFQAQRVAKKTGLLLNGRLIEVADNDVFFNNPQDDRVLAFVRGDMIY